MEPSELEGFIDEHNDSTVVNNTIEVSEAKPDNSMDPTRVLNIRFISKTITDEQLNHFFTGAICVRRFKERKQVLLPRTISLVL